MSLIRRFSEDPYRLTKQALTDPKSVLFELNRQFYRFRIGSEFDPRGIDIFREDWDNCIILDACRYDWYSTMTPFERPVERKRSRGSATKQFIAGNFTGRALTDTVYVSANWHLWHMWDELDCEIHDAVRLPHDRGATTDPETVTDAATEAANAYPDKRLVVHYMQPHRPYLGYEDDFDQSARNVRGTVKSSGISRDTLVEAYTSNLRRALSAVEDLVDRLVGKTVVTADHGELLGERTRPIPVRWYGHPYAFYIDELTTVPWQVVRTTLRRDVLDGSAGRVETGIDDEVEQNLRELGYIDA